MTTAWPTWFQILLNINMLIETGLWWNVSENGEMLEMAGWSVLQNVVNLTRFSSVSLCVHISNYTKFIILYDLFIYCQHVVHERFHKRNHEWLFHQANVNNFTETGAKLQGKQ